jgi:hypothetical protein
MPSATTSSLSAAARPKCCISPSLSLRVRILALLTRFRGADRGANDHRSRATSGHIQPLQVRSSGTLGHVYPDRATLRECLLSSGSRATHLCRRGGPDGQGQPGPAAARPLKVRFNGQQKVGSSMLPPTTITDLQETAPHLRKRGEELSFSLRLLSG